MQNLSTESILFKLHRISEWRTSKAEQFPDDPRNQKAASVLKEFARTPIDSIRPDLRTKLESHVETPSVRDAFNEAAREIGFRRHPTDLNAFLDSVLIKLSPTTTH